jgi:hypothetical protein
MTGDKVVYIDKEALQSLKTASMGMDDHLQQHKLKVKKQQNNCYAVAS